MFTMSIPKPIEVEEPILFLQPQPDDGIGEILSPDSISFDEPYYPSL